MLIEDAHVNVTGILQHFDNFMTAGDYLIIDDTNPLAPSVSGQGLLGDDYTEYGTEKLDALAPHASQ